MEENRTKFHATEEEQNPNTKFLDNILLQNILKNKELDYHINKRLHIDFSEHKYIFRRIYFHFAKSHRYAEYMNSEERSFEEDKKLIFILVKNYLFRSQLLYDIISEINIEWEDDYAEIQPAIISNLKNIEEGTKLTLIEDYDIDFAIRLFDKSVEMEQECIDFIKEKGKNWDIDRVALIDMLLIRMCVSEMLIFEKIPTNVSLSEYIEISKEYSTPKSKLFVNGIANKFMIDLRAKGLLNKTEVEEEE